MKNVRDSYISERRTTTGRVFWAENEMELLSFLINSDRRDIVVAKDRGVFLSVLACNFATMTHDAINSFPTLIVTDVFRIEERDRYRDIFDGFLASADDTSLLNRIELREVLQAPNRNELFIATRYLDVFDCVVFFTASLDQIVIPRSWFEASLSIKNVDLRRTCPVDHGQTVVVGNAEIAVDAILYDFDPDFRRKARKRRRDNDKSIGGSIRRLRLQRGLRQAEFPGISRREINRIERGQVKKPHQSRLSTIADRLGVSPAELASF